MTGFELFLLVGSTLGCGFVLGCFFMQHMTEPFDRDSHGKPIPETLRREPIVSTRQVAQVCGVLLLLVIAAYWTAHA